MSLNKVNPACEFAGWTTSRINSLGRVTASLLRTESLRLPLPSLNLFLLSVFLFFHPLCHLPSSCLHCASIPCQTVCRRHSGVSSAFRLAHMRFMARLSQRNLSPSSRSSRERSSAFERPLRVSLRRPQPVRTPHSCRHTAGSTLPRSEPRRAAVALIIRVVPSPHSPPPPTPPVQPSLSEFFDLDWVKDPHASAEILFLHRTNPNTSKDVPFGQASQGRVRHSREAHVAFPGGRMEADDEGGQYTGLFSLRILPA